MSSLFDYLSFSSIVSLKEVILNVHDVCDESMHGKERPLYPRESNAFRCGFGWLSSHGSTGLLIGIDLL